MEAREITTWIHRFAEVHHGIVCGRAAHHVGITYEALDHRCRSDELVRLTTNVFRLPGHPVTWESRLWAALVEAGPRSVVGLRSAARLHGLWRYRSFEGVEIVTRRGGNHKGSLSRLVETSLLDPDHRIEIAGIPCTSLARTIFDLLGDPDHRPLRSEAARHWHEDRMMAVVNDAMRHHGLTVLVELAVLGAIGRRGRSGTALTRKIFGALGSGYVPEESHVESVFSALLRRSHLPPPEKQADVLDDEGFIGRVDFLWRDLRLVVEIDSRWHDGPLDQRADAERDRRLQALGYRVLRFRWPDLVQHPDRVLRALHRAAASANRR